MKEPIKPRPRLDDLVAAAFQDLAVVQKMQVPGYPKPAQEQREDAGSFEQFWSRWQPSFLHQVTCEDGSRLAYCDKTNPHARFDSMILQIDRDVRTAVSDLSAPQARYVMDRAWDFVHWISTPEVLERFALDRGCLHLVFNTDPHTLDRENGMGYTKRFHLHMNYWPRQDIAGDTRRLREVEPAERRRLLDPVTPVAAGILADLARDAALFTGHEVFDGPPQLEVDARLPPGFKVRLQGGWSALLDPRWLADLQAFHQVMTRAFEDLQEAFTGHREPAPAGSRHHLLDREDIRRRLRALPWLRRSGAPLEILAETLHNASPRFMRRTESHPALRKRHLVMNGLNYSTGLYSQDRNERARPLRDSRNVWLVLQVKLFSDVGGAGMIYNSEAGIVEIARRARLFTAEEARLRRDFQRSFLTYVQNRTHGLQAAGGHP